jgi:hypothetical protein
MPKYLTISVLAVAFVAGAAASELRAAGAETGTTSVSMSIDGARLTIELTTDPETLLARLDRLAGRGRPAATAGGRVADAIVRRQAELLRHIVVQFDDRVARVGVDAVAAVETSADDDSASPRVVITLSAVVPDAAYPLTICQGPSVTSETIAGADPSAPVALVDRRRPDAGRRFWALFVPALFAALITLRVRERRLRLT